MAGKIEDAKFSTIQPVVSALLGLISDNFNCPNSTADGEIEQLRHRVAELEHVESEKEKLERHLAALRENHAKELETVHADTAQRVGYLKERLQETERRASTLLRVALLLGAFIITFLTIDCLNPNIGFFRW